MAALVVEFIGDHRDRFRVELICLYSPIRMETELTQDSPKQLLGWQWTASLAAHSKNKRDREQYDGSAGKVRLERFEELERTGIAECNQYELIADGATHSKKPE